LSVQKEIVSQLLVCQGSIQCLRSSNGNRLHTCQTGQTFLQSTHCIGKERILHSSEVQNIGADCLYHGCNCVKIRFYRQGDGDRRIANCIHDCSYVSQHVLARLIGIASNTL
jgi:hypothetical protein